MHRLLACLATLLMAIPALAAKNVAAEKAIWSKVEQFQAAWNKHDVKGMVATVTDDVTVINPMGRVANGKSEFETLLTEEHATFMKESRFSVMDPKFQWVRPDLALLDYECDLTNMKKPDGTMGTLKHHIYVVATKKGKEWLAVAMRPYVFLAPPAAGSPTAQ